MYQFGDSISDTGNLVIENPIRGGACARYPYGESIRRPTGRCSDGLLMVDDFALSFNMPLLTPYLARGGNFSYGANFAVAGSTALDAQTLLTMGVQSPGTKSSLSVQLGWFRSHLRDTCLNLAECREKVSNSLILIETGGNDFNHALLQNKPMSDVYPMVPRVVAAVTDAARELINLGAKRIFIPGNFPIGCLPVYLATFQTADVTKYDRMHCLKDLNSFARFQNDQLQHAIRDLREQHPDVRIVNGDYYSALSWLLENAGHFGFDLARRQTACCGSNINVYNFNLRNMCGSVGTRVCSDPHRRVSWDGIHMTQRAYRYMAQWLLRNSFHGLLE
ncbi:GDSL esterase/lipase At1g28590-like [Silene latifolia]|uniref:GDSL esterase/lipase At1g28590-like n=1 Tax=Silene latifolia TaxID=37657 RepID=UPI003D783BB8